MTSSNAAPDDGGAGSVLVIWSLVVVVIGAVLFSYSILVTLRGNRARKRRRRAPQSPPLPRPMPPPPASRPLALPSGPMVGGMPVVGRPGALAGPRALPSGPPPLALPAGSMHRFPSAPPQGFQLPTGPGPQLPTGPVVGTGYGGASSIYGTPGQQNQPNPSYGQGSSSYRPASHPGQPLPSHFGGETPAIAATPAPPPAPTTYGIYGAPASSDSHAAASYPSPSYARSSYADTGYADTSYADTSYAGTTSYPPSSETTKPAVAPAEGRASVPVARTDQASDRKRSRPDECATLRAECEQLREMANEKAAAAAQAATDAETAHADHITAMRAAEDARRAHDLAVREAADVAAQIAALERPTAVPMDQRLQEETSHAAFAAYRRGDITSEQLREVFKRAEGWTPEHDRLSRRSTELRAEEAEAARARDAAVTAEQAAAERAHQAAITARALDDVARTAAADARGRCAAADACEQRTRRR